jgi:protein TBF1
MELGRPAAKSLKTVSRMKIESLSILDNLSTQILSTLSKTTPQDIRSLLSQGGHPNTETARDFATVRSLFEQTKRVYITTSPFLSPYELELLEPPQIETLRKANYATFFSSIFTSEISLQELDEHFLNIFVPDNGRLLKAQASILLDLKTQAIIASTQGNTETLNETLKCIFPDGMEAKLLAKRPGAKTLVPSEQDFIKRSISRRDILSAEINKGGLPSLSNRYKWEDFIREISLYLNKNFEIMCPPGSDRENLQAGRLVPATAAHGGLQQGEMEGLFTLQRATSENPKAASTIAAPKPQSPPPVAPPAPPTELQQEDFVAKAAWAARIALEGNSQTHSYSSPYQTPPPPLPTPPPPQHYAPQPYQQTQPAFQHYQPSTVSSSKHNNPQRQNSSPEVPHVSQTAPTQVLYELARQAATAKAPKPTRANTPSQRRPWTTEEENALMAGLDRARGPHWSQILAMFGPGGTINESLKDRNQVQLKDKARNLKLFFLKSGIEVPYYLKHVTGDLRTRAPAQASKQEALERERMQGLEDRAHFDGVQGIMALAGGGNATATGNGIGGSQAHFNDDSETGHLPDQSTPPLPELAPEDDNVVMETMESVVDAKVLDPDL